MGYAGLRDPSLTEIKNHAAEWVGRTMQMVLVPQRKMCCGRAPMETLEDGQSSTPTGSGMINSY